MERRLAAILAADIVGYSRLMGQDEAGTLAALRSLRDGLVSPLVAQHRGRIVKQMGDGFLVEFASAVDAVTCALAWQSQEQDQNFQVRIGINLGEIVFEEGDIYGDGVNIAARLEQVAEPGGICISDLVYQTVAGRLDGPADRTFRDLGQLSLKNIDRKVRAWHWNSGTKKPSVPTVEPKPTASKISLAIRPLTCLSRDPAHRDFAEGLTRELIIELGRFSVFSAVADWGEGGEETPGDARSSSHALGAQYLLDGTLQASSRRIRISLQVTEVASGEQVWTERFDGDPEDLLDFQDEVTPKICGLLYYPLFSHAGKQAHRRAGDASGIHDLQLKAFHLIEHPTEAGVKEAHAVCLQVLDLDPGFALIHEQLAWVHIHSAFNAWVPEPQVALREARRVALRGVALDQREAYLRQALGLVDCLLGRVESGLEEARLAIRLNPYDVEFQTFLGASLTFIGRHDEAMEAFRQAEQLSADYPPTHLFKGTAYLFAGQPDQAAPLLQRLLNVLPEYNWGLVCLAACQALLGEREDAEDSLAILHRQGRGMGAGYIRALLSRCQPAYAEKLLSALSGFDLPSGTTVIGAEQEARAESEAGS